MAFLMASTCFGFFSEIDGSYFRAFRTHTIPDSISIHPPALRSSNALVIKAASRPVCVSIASP